jgi:hypothetical protein
LRRITVVYLLASTPFRFVEKRFGTDLSERFSKISALIDVGKWKNRDECTRVTDREHLDRRLTELESNLSQLEKALGLSYRCIVSLARH